MSTKLPWVQNPDPVQYVCVSDSLVDENDFQQFINSLREHPGKRVAWSTHQSRGAARQRINALRQSKRFQNLPNIRFESRAVPVDGKPEEFTYYIILYWDDQVTNPIPTSMEISISNEIQMSAVTIADVSRKLWDSSFDEEYNRRLERDNQPNAKLSNAVDMVYEIFNKQFGESPRT